MDRPACVDVPALPLQLLLRRRPEWAGRPIAVVAADRPQALVLLADRAARRAGVTPGMRHGAALSLVPGLRAEAVSEDDVACAAAAIVERLSRFTPGVEPSAETGVFFLDASGLTRLHGSLAAWAQSLSDDLAAVGFRARIAVGFTRFGVYAAAKAARGVVVFETADDERRFARSVPIGRLGIAPALAAAFEKLDIRTVEGFLRLPEESLLSRFGEDARALRRFAEGGEGRPLTRVHPVEPLALRAAWERPELDATRLVFVAERLVDRLLAQASARAEAVTEISLRFVLDRHPPREERLAPATPTLDAAQILDLVRLRMASLRFESGVVEMRLAAASVAAGAEQLRLFVQRPRRDPAAAQRAFARLRAEFGEDAVVVARLADSHLAEESFVWERLDRLVPAQRRIVASARLVRRLLAKPLAIPSPDPARLSPPDLLDTRWWKDEPVRREDRFFATRRCHLSWVRHDLIGDAWLVLGDVR